MIIDLHKIANTPGAGKASAELIKAGAWDAHAGTGEPTERAVLIRATYTVYETVHVTARNDKEAHEKALMAFNNHLVRVGTIMGIDCEDIEVDE